MEVFIIALSKDQIVVWLATFKHEHSEHIFLLATPYGRMKDFSKRLESLYAKKVKGNRLDHLDANALDLIHIPFVSEYTSSVFRISDLAGFGASFPLKANFAQTQALTLAANFLKDKYSDCQFMIRYDAKSFRSSTINNWLKKNTLNAKLDPIVLEASLELQTATLFAALFVDDRNEQFNDPQIQEVIQKLNANIKMSPRWQSVDSAALYLDLFNSKWKDLLKAIFTKAPRLMDEGLVEKWLKKQIDGEYLKIVLACLELEDGEDLVLSSSMNRLAIEYEKHLEKLKQEQHRYDLDEFNHWVCLHDQAAKTQIHEAIDLGVDQWQQSIEQAMEQWIENPHQVIEAKTIYLVAQDEKVAIFSFDSLDYTKKLFEQYINLDTNNQEDSNRDVLMQRLQDSIVFQTGYLKDLDTVLAEYSIQPLLPHLYCSSSMYHLVMKLELIQNRFVPCYSMNAQQKSWIHQLKDRLYPDCFELMNQAKQESMQEEESAKAVESRDLLDSSDDLPSSNQETNIEEKQVEQIQEEEIVWPQPTKTWFKTNIHQKIKVEYLKAIAKSNLSFSQIRLVGQALARGLHPKLLDKILRHPDWLDEIVIPYLFNSRKQKWFIQQREKTEQPLDCFYLCSNWSVSKLEAIAKLVQDGLNESWIKTNVKGNMTLGQIEQLKTIYPYGKLPQQYAMSIPIPSSVEHWLIKQASKKHPDLSKDELYIQLSTWNAHLFQDVLENQTK